MKHFYNNVTGWFTFPNLYSSAVNRFDSGSHFVEVGAWKGKSASFMIVEIINSGKDIKFDCVDTWEGSAEHKKKGGRFYEPLLEQKDGLYKKFKENLKSVETHYTPVRLPSIEASKKYEDESLDFVFIDAAHDYENVMKDIAHWLPKVKSGGILAGHDVNHPPVKKAVEESFGANYRGNPREDVWVFEK